MARFFSARVVSHAIILAFSFVALTASAQVQRRHPGKTVDFGTEKPAAVQVKAWPESLETGKQGDCPLFGSAPIDSARSDNAGKFQLSIGVKFRTYTATYCASGYYPRADRDIPNTQDGTPVIPMPVELFPRMADSEQYANAVRIKTLMALNDLAYLQSIDPPGFEKVIAKFAASFGEGYPAKWETFKDLSGAVRGWQGFKSGGFRDMPNK